MSSHIIVKLFATLGRFMPESSEHYPITPGITVRELLCQLGVPETEAKLIFVNNLKAEADSVLSGGERVAVFPPVGGG